MPAPDHLPEDPKQWPSNPFELLGVRPGGPEREIKRAYTRLIRRYKPEHAPDQFRRVREAYEICLVQNRWYEAGEEETECTETERGDETAAPRGELPTEAPNTREIASPPDPVPFDRETSPANRPPSPPPKRPQPLDEVDRLWALAVENQEAVAYEGLAVLARARPEQAEVPLRLYWLLSLNPALDPERTRHDWLAEALNRSRLSGPAAELYRRELEAGPDGGLSDPYVDLLSRPAPTSDRLAVARWRVAAAGRAEEMRWAVIVADLNALRSRVPHEDETGWLALLVAVRDWTLFGVSDESGVASIAKAELDRLRHLELRQSYHFDRLEETEHLAATWRIAFVLQGVAPKLSEVVRLAWAGGGDVRFEELAPALAEIAADPLTMLSRFDSLVQAGNTGPIQLLLRTLNRCLRFHSEEQEFPPEWIRGLARKLRPLSSLRNYAKDRRVVLNFLIAESISPWEMAAACDHDPEEVFRDLATNLRTDVALHLIWLAVKV